ncbi:MAG: response regulator, partial [Clostridiales Family XIII bacterium]|nr:response regulator [Clostridiales Family XIII bacterium]
MKKYFTMRVLAAIALTGIAIAVIIANLAMGISFTEKVLLNTAKEDMKLAADLADDLISTQIRLLKSDANVVAERLNMAGMGEHCTKIMEEQTQHYPHFIAMSVIGRNGQIAEYGDMPLSADLIENSPYIRHAFDGESTITTTRIDDTTGKLVVRLCVPMKNDRVLCVTVPGMFLSDILADYRLYKTGNIFMIDDSGTVIASFRTNLVKSRTNFITLGAGKPDEKYIGNFFKRMLSSDEGFGVFTYQGIDRYCSFKRVSASLSNWRIAVSAPIPETPSSSVSDTLILTSLIMLGICMVIISFASRLVASPYEKLKKQKAHMDELREAAESSSRAKTYFLANMSHEMRTPLNAIIGLSELALEEDGEMGAGSREKIEKVHTAGMNLLGIVNDILDISKIESGKFEIVDGEYDTPSMINDTVMVNMTRIGHKPIDFKLKISNKLPVTLIGDELRIKQIYNNLLSNAFKYTKVGTVEWRVYHEVDASGTFWLVSQIKDTGVGIKDTDISKLFEDYSQVSNAQEGQRIEGTGLGLSITRSLVDSMGGSIEVESEYAKGSTFTVRIKQIDPGSPAIGAEGARSLENFSFNAEKRKRQEGLARVQLPHARVLSVDDVVTNHDVARGFFKPYGLKVDCVTSGFEAIEIIKKGDVKYDAIFMDHMMPDMDGIETTRRIREEIGTEYARTVPIIALTADAIVGNDKKFLENGFQDFLSKPVDIQSMDAVIRKWVAKKEPRNPDDGETAERILRSETAAEEVGLAAEQAQGAGAGVLGGGGSRAAGAMDLGADGLGDGGSRAADAMDLGDDGLGGGSSRAMQAEPAQGDTGLLRIEGIDAARGLEVACGDMSVFMDVLRSYLSNTPMLLSRLQINLGNMKEYAVTVHGIKGSSRNIGAEKIGQHAEALEHAAKDGNRGYIASEHDMFVNETEYLLQQLDRFFKELDGKCTKPTRAGIDRDALRRLCKASEIYDIDNVEEEVKQLSAFKYERSEDNDLVAYLVECRR